MLRLLILVFFLLLIIPSATPLNFDFPSFGPQNYSISIEGDAFLDPESLRLTKSAVGQNKTQSVGRATYKQHFLLRDEATGKLADFNTSFSFLHRFAKKRQLRSTASYEYPFVAVEFDIYPNPDESIKDPPFEYLIDHVGIDVNSLKSRVTEYWNGGILNGSINTATVRYDSSTNNLSVHVTDTFSLVKSISSTVNLTKYLPDRVIVGFSASTGASFALHKIISWNFTSSLDESLPIAPIPAVAAPPTSPASSPTPEPTTTVDLVPPPDAKPRNKHKIKLQIGMGVGGGIILVVMVACLVFFIYRVKTEKWESDEDPMVNGSIDEEFEKETGPKMFSYKELARVTNNFAEGEKLGQGGFGGVYKGFFKDSNTYVAVKRMSKGSEQGIKEYAAEVRIISRLSHRNLVKLIGWCHKKRLLLVYELMPKGSLESHLYKQGRLLDWGKRYKIAQGLAAALLYLHQECEQCVLHRDIKSSNVMLDPDFNAKLGDFGLARLVDHGRESRTTIVAGTMGYIAMEYFTTGKASKESDVYSFGVVALEIACGRKPFDSNFEGKQIHIVEWVWELYGEEKIIEAADPKLCGDFDEKQMECLMVVGLWCAHPDYNSRPPIQQAIQVLNFELPLPSLPSKMPVAFAHSAAFSTCPLILLHNSLHLLLVRTVTNQHHLGKKTKSSIITVGA
ncbi:hypothetical protein M0R45_014769 [Rubus argutus]|uniref:Protein kinase domain-containing protein n=1 Tax=Rubus argutus TaxID=59490 RepID=A0AAW1XNX8_RUBAR